ncbi:hypothetical protein [Reyranella sp.]|uniref:hypothetical protein n=1 Tax=Reyranella sp. TaxID=1929291 RepID=UPI0011F57E6F|nr:hypothetical protein [Reyranella sp.]TAJ82892.1 MAG: hypothetical protein EPO50_24645 [Reyranella sp.]
MANTDTTTSITQADAFVVVSWWQDESSNARKGHYSYEHCASPNEVSDLYGEYDSGEYGRAHAVGMFPARNGMPSGERLTAITLARLVRETLAA